MQSINKQDRAIGAFVGLAIGDALGTTLEFASRDSRPLVTDIVGGGPFGLKPGEWTDDTSMALCLAESILNKNDIDPQDLMNRFRMWSENGHNSVTGSCFDIGQTVSSALQKFAITGDPLSGNTDPYSAGNGSLMRLSPVAIRWFRNPAKAREAAMLQSRTTHGARQAVEACALFATILAEAINGRTKEEVLKNREWQGDPGIGDIASGKWKCKSRDEINSSGYVIHSLEASLWSTYHSENFRDAVILAVNLAGDADTIGAVTGQIAGALWGLAGIPDDWLKKIAWSNKLIDTAKGLFELANSSKHP